MLGLWWFRLITWSVAWFSIMVWLSGCSAPLRPAPRIRTAPQFETIYQQLRDLSKPLLQEADKAEKLTLSAVEMPLPEFVQWLARRSNLTLVFAQNLSEKTVSLEVRNQSPTALLTLICRQLDVSLSRVGEAWYLGTSKPEDATIFVRRVRRLTDAEAQAVLQSASSSEGRSVVVGDSLVMVTDRFDVIPRIVAALDAIESAPSITWVIQLHVVSFSDNALRDLGVDVRPAAELGLTFAASSASILTAAKGVDTIAKLDGSLDALLRTTQTRGDSRVEAEPVLLLLDGTEGKISLGERFPVARRTVSDQGTVTTSGYDFIQTGLTIAATCREVDSRLGRLTLAIERSSVARLVDDVPVTSRESFDSTSDVVAGGVYLVAALLDERQEKGRSLWLQMGDKHQFDRRTIFVWARVHRIDVPVGGVPGSAGEERSEGGAIDLEREGTPRPTGAAAVGMNEHNP
jgi:type II secretory pathway component GspD/PulD (secretin)